MAKKILIAMDTSKNAMKVAEYAARNIEKQSFVTLYHAFFKTPREGMDSEERLPHHNVSFSGNTQEFQKWLRQKRIEAEHFLETAREILIDAGFNASNIAVKVVESKRGIVKDILDETRKGNCEMLVIGRSGKSGLKGLLKRNIADKIIDQNRGFDILVAES